MINTNDLESITLQSGEKVTGRFLPDGTFDPVIFLVIPKLTDSAIDLTVEALKSELNEYKKLNKEFPSKIYFSNIVSNILYAIYGDIKTVPLDNYSIMIASSYSYNSTAHNVNTNYFVDLDNNNKYIFDEKELKKLITSHMIFIACYKSVLKTILNTGLSMSNEEVKDLFKHVPFYIAGELASNGKVHINALKHDYNISTIDQMEYFLQGMIKDVTNPNRFFNPSLNDVYSSELDRRLGRL